MASLRRVAELNNSGASMLVAARDKDAFKTLQTALSIMEQEMLAAPDKIGASSASSNSTESSSISNNNNNDNDAPTTSAALSTSGEAGSASLNDDSNAARFYIDTKSSTAIPELRDDRYFIFNQALLVVETTRVSDADTASPPPSPGASQRDVGNNDEPDPPYSQALVCFYTSVVIYNLALAYHKRGMVAVAGSSNTSSSSSAKNATLALSQSLRLYEHCLKIVRSISNYSEDCKMLLYAVSCNLAHLYCRKGDRSRAQELLEGLEEANHFSYQNLI
jgi:hypothetical protein